MAFTSSLNFILRRPESDPFLGTVKVNGDRPIKEKVSIKAVLRDKKIMVKKRDLFGIPDNRLLR